MRVSRKTGTAAGALLMVLGLWGALIPFVGPYFDYGFGANETWVWHTSRLWMNVLPGAAVFLAGLVLAGLAERITMAAAAWLACAAGAWFAVAPVLSVLWNNDTSLTGAPLGGPRRQALEYLGSYYGLGAAIVFLGALALGRLSARAAPVPQAAAVPEPEVAPAAAPRPAMAPPPAPPTPDRGAAPPQPSRRRRWIRLRRQHGRLA